MIKKYILPQILLISMFSFNNNVQADDKIGLKLNLESHSFKEEPININDDRNTQRNENLGVELYSLIDVGKNKGFYIGLNFYGSLSNNGDNAMNYSGVFDFAPYGIGTSLKYEAIDYPIGAEVQLGYSYAKIDKTTADGVQYGANIFYKITKKINLGLQYKVYDLSYTKNGTTNKINTKINSMGMFISYDLF